jgi:tetratricopeptide (TPR) repeat protein
MKAPVALLAIAALILAIVSPVYPQESEWERLTQEAAQRDRAGEYERAEFLTKQALELAEKAAGPNHPTVATSLNNLAVLYRVQGRYAQAEPLYNRALAIEEKALGPDHPWVATSLENMAALYRKTGRDTEAELLEKRAAGRRRKRVLGHDEEYPIPGGL